MANIGHAEARIENTNSGKMAHISDQQQYRNLFRNINFFITAFVSQFLNSSLFFKSAEYFRNSQ